MSTQENTSIHVENFTIKCPKRKKLLGINIDDKLKFEVPGGSISQKANKKINALARITNYRELPKRCILMNAFFKSQFNDRPAIWMFHSQSLNNKIKRLHERCLRIIHNDNYSNFEELLTITLSLSTIKLCMHLLLKCTNCLWFLARNIE